MTVISSGVSRLLVVLLISAGLAACGGGGGPGAATPTPAPTPTPTPTPEPTPTPTPISIVPEFELHSLAEFPVGVAVSAGSEGFSIFNASDASARRDIVVEHFSQLTAGNIMKMSYLHPEEETFTWTDADQLVGFAETNGMTIHGHALVWHPSYQVPAFMNNYVGDFEAMLSNHVTTIVQHFSDDFPDVVVSWDVVNEAIEFGEGGGVDGWRRSVFYNELPPSTEGDIPEYIRVAFSAARAADPAIDLYYNDYDNTGNADRLAKTLEIAETLEAEGLIDGVGFQMHVYMGYPGVPAFENAFQSVVDLGLKVKITELDIPIFDPYTGTYDPDNPIEALTVDIASQQRVRYCQVIKAYLDTTAATPELRGGITVWGLTDEETWLINQYANAFGKPMQVWPLLFNADLSAKPALQGFADALTGASCTP